MSGFASPLGDFNTYFMTTTELIDRYVKGGMFVWGWNAFGQLGDSTTSNKSSPVQTIAGGTNWTQIVQHSLDNNAAAIKSDGTLWLWGSNTYGQLGDSTTSNKSSPVQTITGGTNWKQVSIDTSTAAIKTDGTLWVWGKNGYGQLGDNTITNRSSPVQTIAGGNNWKQISNGSIIAAIKNDGTLWVWGRNDYGQLGDNTTTYRSSPVQTIAGGTNWKQVSVGGFHTAAIKTDGTLWIWGYNTNAALGDSTTTNKSSPIQTIVGGTNWKQISCGGNHSAAIKNDGSLWTWGYNNSGGLGDNTATIRSSPVQTIAGGTNWKQVSAGGYHTAAIKTDSTLWCWGSNTYGLLGDSTTSNKSSPVQTITGGTNWKQVSAGASHTVATNYSDI